MELATSIHLPLRTRTKIVLTGILIVLGLAANALPFEVLNTHFIFGSVFAMLALLLCGPVWGIVAGAVVSAATVLLWNHPWAMLTMTFEMLFVAAAVSRFRSSLILADAVYWIVLGMPLGLLGLHFISGYPLASIGFIVVKQSINGIANALAARIFLILLLLFRRVEGHLVPFRGLLADLLAFFVTAMVLIVIFINDRVVMNELNDDIRLDLFEASERVSGSIREWVVRDSASDIEHLARMAANLDPGAMQPYFEHACASDPRLGRITWIAQDATILAYAGEGGRVQPNTIGTVFGGLPAGLVFPQGRTPAVYGPMDDGLGGVESVISLVFPVVTPVNELRGYLIGGFRIDALAQNIEAFVSDSDIRFSLADADGRIIAEDPRGLWFRDGEPETGQVVDTGDGVFLWTPVLAFNTPSTEEWGRSVYSTRTAVESLGWSFRLEKPVAPYQARLYERYSMQFAVFFGIMLVAVAMSYFVSRLILRNIDGLRKLSGDLPGKITSNLRVRWPKSIIKEIQELIENFRDMTVAMRAQFGTVERLNESLERQVEERTAELQRTSESLKTLVNSSLVAIIALDGEGRVTQWNPAAERIFGWTEKEVVGGSLPIIPPGMDREYARMSNKLMSNEAFVDDHVRRQRKDGTLIDISISAAPLHDSAGRIIGSIGLIADISRQRLVEERLRQSLAEKDTLIRELYHRTKNNMQVISSMLALKASMYWNKEIDNFVQEIGQRILSMALVHQKLYQSQDLSHIALHDYLTELIALVVQGYSQQSSKVTIDAHFDEVQVLIDTAIPCGLILNELLSNTLLHAFPEDRNGTIRVRMTQDRGGTIEIFYRDDGVGVPAGFDFRAQENSLGLQMIVGLVEQQLQGEVSIDTEAGLGYTIRFSDTVYTERV